MFLALVPALIWVREQPQVVRACHVESEPVHPVIGIQLRLHTLNRSIW